MYSTRNAQKHNTPFPAIAFDFVMEQGQMAQERLFGKTN
jgi:hypothetical protein